MAFRPPISKSIPEKSSFRPPTSALSTDHPKPSTKSSKPGKEFTELDCISDSFLQESFVEKDEDLPDANKELSFFNGDVSRSLIPDLPEEDDDVENMLLVGNEAAGDIQSFLSQNQDILPQTFSSTLEEARKEESSLDLVLDAIKEQGPNKKVGDRNPRDVDSPLVIPEPTVSKSAANSKVFAVKSDPAPESDDADVGPFSQSFFDDQELDCKVAEKAAKGEISVENDAMIKELINELITKKGPAQIWENLKVRRDKEQQEGLKAKEKPEDLDAKKAQSSSDQMGAQEKQVSSKARHKKLLPVMKKSKIVKRPDQVKKRKEPKIRIPRESKVKKRKEAVGTRSSQRLSCGTTIHSQFYYEAQMAAVEIEAKEERKRKLSVASEGDETEVQKKFNKKEGALITKKRMERLLKMRTEGTWVECDSCKKWRFLADVKDPATLGDTWTCDRNPDKNFQDCVIPQQEITDDPAKFVECKFTVGSLVWAKLEGLPWWPALVDDDPDTETFFWTNEDSDVPTWYHVVFFDRLAKQVARAWIKRKYILKLECEVNDDKIRKSSSFHTLSQKTLNKFEEACSEAKKAAKMDLFERRNNYCFLNRFKGRWGLPWDLNLKDSSSSNEDGTENSQKN